MPGPPAMNVFVVGTPTNPVPVNANFSNLVAAVTSVDNSQIGANGIYASQVVPTNSSQATFGGSQAYTFSNPVKATTVTGSAGVFSGSANGVLAPVYVPGGSSFPPSSHIVAGSAVITVSGAGLTLVSINVALTGAAAFTVGYYVLVTLTSSPSFPAGWNVSTTTFFTNLISETNFFIEAASSTVSTGAGSINMHYLAIGS